MYKANVVIVGGGLIGLTMAAALLKHDFSVVVVDAKKSVSFSDGDGLSAKVSALNASSTDLLKTLGIWEKIPAQYLSPIRAMQVWDALGGGQISFDASAIKENQVATVVDNHALQSVLSQHLEQQATLLWERKPLSIVHHNNKVTLKTEQGDHIEADLLIGADGVHSWVRESQGFKSQYRPYHHHAIISVLQTEKPHGSVARQVFLPAGPLGTLPLGDAHHVAMIWSTSSQHANALMMNPQTSLGEAVTEHLGQPLGTCQVINTPVRIPLTMRHVRTCYQGSVVLVGDAAHHIHPLAGLGANMGFADVQALVTCMSTASPTTPRSYQGMLREYDRSRRCQVNAQLALMRAFKEVFSSQSPLIVFARSLGFNLCDKQRWLKKRMAQWMG